MNANDTLALALDRFDVPPMSAGLADRIAAAAAKPPVLDARTPPRRDRRGLWRRGRQVLIGTVAAGMLSAAAVASGLLGQVGIEVPVLTAMLAPKTKHVAPKPHHVAAPKPVSVAPKPVEIAGPPVVVPTLPGPPTDEQRLARREIVIERRVARQQFAVEHPVAAAAIREKVRQRLRERAIERRMAIGPGPLDPAAASALELANRRDRRRAAAMIDRRIAERQERMGLSADQTVGPAPAAQGPLSLPRAAAPLDPVLAERRQLRRQQFQQMSPDQRMQVIERRRQFRAQRMQRAGQLGNRD